jgi:hypothetical protein
VVDVLALLVPLVPVLAICLWLGIRLLWASRQLDGATTPEDSRIPVAPDGSVAAKVDSRLQRARARVETMVMPGPVPGDDLAPSAFSLRDRAQTYGILGLGLLGLAGAVVLGALLML